MIVMSTLCATNNKHFRELETFGATMMISLCNHAPYFKVRHGEPHVLLPAEQVFMSGCLQIKTCDHPDCAFHECGLVTLQEYGLVMGTLIDFLELWTLGARHIALTIKTAEN